MIEVNLLPGGPRKKAAAGAPSLNFKEALAGLNARMGDKVLIGTVAVMIAAAGAGGYLYYRAGADRADAETRLAKAIEDSTRYAKVVALRQALEAKRDTLRRQVNLIRAIDDDRYIWPHIMDEVSRALPQFTWIAMMGIGGNPQGATNVVAAPPAPKPKPNDTTAAAKKIPPVQTEIPRDAITVRLTGRTADIQAMTRFMSLLEDSPFFANIYNEGSNPSAEAGAEYFQFQLTFNYTRPDSTVVRRLPLVASGR